MSPGLEVLLSQDRRLGCESMGLVKTSTISA